VIFLSSTSDKIQIVTGSAGAIDVHADYVDLAGSTVTPDRKNTKITTATTTDVVGGTAGAVPGSTVRNLKGVNVNNIHASVPNLVTIQHVDNGPVTVQLEQVLLQPGERIAYSEGGSHVYDAQGRIKVPALGLPTGGSNTADVVANAADTYLAGSSMPIGGRIQAGSYFKWRFRATKTAAGTATPAFNIRFGTAGAVADTSRNLLTSAAAQTAVADTAAFEMDGRFEVVGASAVFDAWIRMDHASADGAGFGTFRYIQTQSATFDATAAGLIMGVSCNPGATGTPVWTFQSIIVEAGNLLS
jgi:hypothetical protein